MCTVMKSTSGGDSRRRRSLREERMVTVDGRPAMESASLPHEQDHCETVEWVKASIRRASRAQ